MAFKVFIVDDEPIIVKSLANIINWQDLDCLVAGTAENGKQALERIKALEPDLVLSDICMPSMNGLELLKEVSQLPRQPKVILLSGYDEFEYAREGIKYKAFDYILKPIDYDELEECVSRAIRELERLQKNRQEEIKRQIYELLTLGTADIASDLRHGAFAAMIIEWDKNAEKQDAIWQWLSEKVKQNEPESWFLLKLQPMEFTIVYASQTADESETKRTMKRMASELSACCSDLHISIGKVVTELDRITESYGQAKDMLKGKLFLNATVITEEEFQEELKSRNNPWDLIEKAMDYLDEYFYEDVGIEQVAGKIGLSVSYFSVLFKQKTGVTFLEYLTEQRVKHACYLLEKSSLKTNEIAKKVGYTDQRYFSQVFKKKVRMTPSEYRKVKTIEQPHLP
ncbi:response regulator [Ammoniphilus sp. 3BR4]|uniref:response regulator n=1 Tax=Ammoniphilus sp. 3BR4 TaxID=3158265 RepID=UPI003466F949